MIESGGLAKMSFFLITGVSVVLGVVAWVVRKMMAETNSSDAKSSSGGDAVVRALADAGGTLYRFLQEVDCTPRCQDELDQTPGLEIGGEGNPFTLSKKLAYLVFCDLRDVYARLGHDAKSLHTLEGIGFAMMVLSLICKDFDPAQFDDPIQMGKLLKIVENLLKSNPGDVVVEGHENELRFALIFGRIHHEDEWVVRYASLLYRWASLVAKANGNVSPAESAALKSIMDLRTEAEAGFAEDVRVTGGNEIPSVPAARKSRAKPQTRETAPRKGDAADALKSLDALVGLEPVKREIRSLARFVEIQRQREKAGLRAAPVSCHCVFTGNPGTGKTTVARILAEIYRDLGVVEKGHLIETDRSGLVGEYVGQTAVKTNKIVDAALGGVLFIDEAYALVQGGEKDYGREAVATLLKRMEDERNRLVVILAGYPDEMKAFVDSNPGLRSRFNRCIAFPDYDAEELARIFLAKAKECQYVCNAEVQAAIVDVMKRAVAAKDGNFGNGRFVRNFFEDVLRRQAERLSAVSPLSAGQLAELTLSDLDGAVA